MINNKYEKLNWDKNYGLIPTIIQHTTSGEVLMLGYMSEESLAETERTNNVTFFSRSKNRLWTKGESSGNVLKLHYWYPDCDSDTLLMLVFPEGPTCHKNTNSCFYPASTDFNFLYQLENIISKKKNYKNFPFNKPSSYTTHLYSKGINRIAQKVGEEGVETALAAVLHDSRSLINESSDLVYHLLVLLQHESINLSDIINELRARNDLKKHRL